MEEKVFVKLIKEICNEEDIEISCYSFDYILKLVKNKKIKYIFGYKFDLNEEAASRVMSDKVATYELLNSENIKAAEHKLIFNPLTRSSLIDDDGTWSDIINYFNSHNQKIVIKKIDGACGTDVYLCKSLKELERNVLKILKSNNSLCLCPYYDIKSEYRTFYLSGECLLTYKKNKPYVIGNGKNTLKEIIASNLTDINIEPDDDLDYLRIPDENEKVYLSWKFNLSGGATASLLEDDAKKKQIQELAYEAAKAVNARFATIDIIETTDNELLLLEINSGVTTTKFIENVANGYELAKEIYRKAVNKMLE